MPTTKAKGTETDEKVGPKQKRCADCGVVKNRFKAFKPRWGRCAKHKEQGKPFQEKCKACNEARNSNIRQPRCIECDAIRTKKVAATKVTAKAAGKKGKKGKKGTPVQVPAPADTPKAAPAPTPTPAAAPTSEPAPVVEADALAAVSNLLAEEPAQGVPANSTPF